MAGIANAMLGASGSGWASAGEALGAGLSGGQTSRSQKVYDDTMLRGHRAQRALMEAKKESLEYQSLVDLTFEGVLPEASPAQVMLLNNLVKGGRNADQAMRAVEGMRKQQHYAAAADRAQAGELGAMNQELTLARGVPQTLTKVEGNTLISPYEAMADQTPRITPYGDRQAGAAMARATRPAAPRASTSKATGTDPAKNRAAALKEAAKAIFEEARYDDRDITGMTADTIARALERDGEVRDRRGNVLGTWSWDDSAPVEVEEIEVTPPPAAAVGAPAPPAPGRSTPSAAMSGAPVADQGKSTVPRNDGGFRLIDPINGGWMDPDAAPAQTVPAAQATGPRPPPLGSNASATIQQAQQAIAAGADPQKVRARLQSMGIDPALAGL